MSNVRVRLMLWTALSCLAASSIQAADRPPVLTRHWYVNAGGYLTDFSTDASVGTESRIGTTIQAEDELGVDPDQSIFRLEGLFRFNERHSIDFGYWEVTRNGSQSLDREIEFEDITFDFGASIESEADVSYFRLGWRYSMVRSDRGEAGFSAGVSAFAFDFALEGQGFVSSGIGNISGNYRTEKSFVAPAPTIGLFITYAIHPRVFFRARGDFLDVDLGDFEASLTETMLGFDWFFVEHVGIGVGVLGTRIEYKDRSGDPLSIDYSQSGAMAYLAASF